MKEEPLSYWRRAARALKTARILLNEDPEAASSRAYYAAFYAVTALFALEGRTFSGHSALEVAVHRDLVKAGRWSVENGADFSFLRGLRSVADYGGGIHVSTEDAAKSVETAERILRAVERLRPETLVPGPGNQR